MFKNREKAVILGCLPLHLSLLFATMQEDGAKHSYNQAAMRNLLQQRSQSIVFIG
jgi:hypothetical protein